MSIRILIAGAALATLGVAHAAEAARLVSAPIGSNGASSVLCSIHYLGVSTAPINVLITYKDGREVLRQQTVRMSATNPHYHNSAACGGSFDLCGTVLCAFSFSAPTTDFRASACAMPSDLEEGSTCLEAR